MTIKCITFDKEAQDNLPEHIKAKMKANQEKSKIIGTEKDIDYHLNRIKTIQEALKQQEGNLTCRVLLRQVNCEYNKDKVTMSVKELFHWFETGQHLKEWKEIDTL